MRKILFLALLISNIGYSQIVKYKASDYKISSDVTQYIEKQYTYDSISKLYPLKNKRTIYLSKGLVTKIESEMNYSGYLKVTSVFNYEKGILTSIKTSSDDNETTEKFIYKNGKIVEQIAEGESTTKHIYGYDGKGNLLSETVYDDDILAKEVTYLNYTNPNSYTKKSVDKNDEQTGATIDETYKNGLLVEENYSSNYIVALTKYSYDKYGNVIEFTVQDEYSLDYVTRTNSYVYDSKGNAVKSMSIQAGFFGMPDTKYFTFAKATFSNGTSSGSDKFDPDFVKTFEPESASYQTKETIE